MRNVHAFAYSLNIKVKSNNRFNIFEPTSIADLWFLCSIGIYAPQASKPEHRKKRCTGTTISLWNLWPRWTQHSPYFHHSSHFNELYARATIFTRRTIASRSCSVLHPHLSVYTWTYLLGRFMKGRFHSVLSFNSSTPTRVQQKCPSFRQITQQQANGVLNI